MSRLEPNPEPAALPAAHLDVARRLEEAGVGAWYQGDGLLADLVSPTRQESCTAAFEPHSAIARSLPGRALLCDADARTLATTLPHAVVTSESRRRFSLGTAAGPIDLLPFGGQSIEAVLARFGLSALAFAWRPLRKEFCDPTGALDLLSRGLLDVVGEGSGAEVFRIAPRRYWIAARLLTEYDLEPTPRLVEAASTALPSCRKQIPEGSPARRELQRVLLGRNPATGLRFLHQTGLFEALFPGMDPAGAEIVGRIDANPSLRWAVSLEGASIQRALRRLRMPPRRAREIERLLRHHPIDRTTAAPAIGDAGVRRLRQRLHPEEIEYLLRWRSIQLEGLAPCSETRSDQARLLEIRTQLESLASEQSQSDRIKALAIEGTAVMNLLGRGPGPHIGRALAHLAEVVAATPEANDVARLEVELRHWADLHPE